jgi:tRNA pseudouridine55 synthase
MDNLLTKEHLLAGHTFFVHKALDWTSFNVVAKIRNTARIKKVGHAGTLDPLATGVLIVCTGKNTKKINDYMGMEKEYTGTITLGATTPTYDLESTPENCKDYSYITPKLIYEKLENFKGVIEQVPPIFSAIKINGQTAYNLARKGQDVALKARQITIYEFDITEISLPMLSFRIVCSTGTYIRSIANDFGAALGCGAYLSALCRTRIGQYTLDHCQEVTQIVDAINTAKEPI